MNGKIGQSGQIAPKIAVVELKSKLVTLEFMLLTEARIVQERMKKSGIVMRILRAMIIKV